MYVSLLARTNQRASGASWRVSHGHAPLFAAFVAGVIRGARPKGPESAVHPAVALANLSALISTCDLAIALNGVLLSHASNDSPIGKYTGGQLPCTP
jgi:hypothetical protein